jgi:hypothetical protein
MNTFIVLFECLPCFGFVGFGLYFLLTAMVPSWREKGWNHWKLYGSNRPMVSNRPMSANSWLVQLGFAKPIKPIAEGEFDEKSAWLFYCALGTVFLIIGIGGVALIVYRNIT